MSKATAIGQAVGGAAVVLLSWYTSSNEAQGLAQGAADAAIAAAASEVAAANDKALAADERAKLAALSLDLERDRIRDAHDESADLIGRCLDRVVGLEHKLVGVAIDVDLLYGIIEQIHGQTRMARAADHVDVGDRGTVSDAPEPPRLYDEF